MVPSRWFCHILSLIYVKKKYRVTFDSDLEDGVKVHKGNGSERVFKPSKKGLYYLDMTNNVGTTFVTIVDSIKNKYSDMSQEWKAIL